MTQRIITFYTTVGNNNVAIETDATTFGQLKPLMNEKNIKHENMNLIVDVTETAIIGDDSVLPEGEFVIYITPKKTKSGADLTRPECYSKIKSLLDSGANKDHFKRDGKGYSSLSTQVLNDMINSYSGSTTTTTTKATNQVKEVVSQQSEVPLLNKGELEKLIQNFDFAYNSLRRYLVNDTQTTTANIADVVETVKETKEQEAARLEQERLDAVKKEQERLEQEAKSKLAAKGKFMASKYANL